MIIMFLGVYRNDYNSFVIDLRCFGKINSNTKFIRNAKKLQTARKHI